MYKWLLWGNPSFSKQKIFTTFYEIVESKGVRVKWVLRHMDIERNEEADKQVKGRVVGVEFDELSSLTATSIRSIGRKLLRIKALQD